MIDQESSSYAVFGMDHVFTEGLTNPKKNGKRTVEINLASNFFFLFLYFFPTNL